MKAMQAKTMQAIPLANTAQLRHLDQGYGGAPDFPCVRTATGVFQALPHA